MFRSLLVIAICAGSFTALAQTPATPPVAGQDPQPPAAAPAQGKRNRMKSLQKMDANADGKIARDEWKGQPQGFDTLDSDQDGFLTSVEFRQAARDKGAKMFNQFDANSDGKIARDEWTHKPRAFDRLDANADGFLTPDELRNLKGRRHKQQS